MADSIRAIGPGLGADTRPRRSSRRSTIKPSRFLDLAGSQAVAGSKRKRDVSKLGGSDGKNVFVKMPRATNFKDITIKIIEPQKPDLPVIESVEDFKKVMDVIKGIESFEDKMEAFLKLSQEQEENEFGFWLVLGEDQWVEFQVKKSDKYKSTAISQKSLGDKEDSSYYYLEVTPYIEGALGRIKSTDEHKFSLKMRYAYDGKNAELMHLNRKPIGSQGKFLSGTNAMKIFEILDDTFKPKNTIVNDDAKLSVGRDKYLLRLIRAVGGDDALYQKWGFEPWGCTGMEDLKGERYDQDVDSYTSAVLYLQNLALGELFDEADVEDTVQSQLIDLITRSSASTLKELVKFASDEYKKTGKGDALKLVSDQLLWPTDQVSTYNLSIQSIGNFHLFRKIR